MSINGEAKYGGYGAKGNPLYFVIQFCWEPKTTLKENQRGMKHVRTNLHIIPRVFYNGNLGCFNFTM